jgi:hypothetical protein
MATNSDSFIEELLRVLPQLIRENDTVKGAILTALSGVVATREDIERQMAASERRFEASERRFNELLTRSDQRFDGVDRRIEAVDQRFDGVDQRFEAVDQRFEAVDQRFDGVDQRFDGVDQRFEAVDQRFNGVDQRFNSVDYHLKKIDHILQRIERKGGIQFEHTVLELMRETLALEDIDPERIRTEKLVDAAGFIFPAGYGTDIDVVVENGNLYLVEVKSKVQTHDVGYFSAVARLYRHVHQREPTGLILIALSIEEDAMHYARELGMRVVAGEVLEWQSD